ncbi:hypothetical protein JCM5353_007750 [Sporobolomyces roseus]
MTSASSDQSHSRRKRILIVGAGASGMACADQLSLKPDQFEVTVIEAASYCGGQAFSIALDGSRFGTSWLNQGVQGGSHVYHHVYHYMAKQRVRAEPVNLSFSFGKGEMFWTNLFPTEFVREHAEDIKRFKSALGTMSKLIWIFGLIPVKRSLRMFRFSDEFIERMIYPTLSLWFGTGNTTPDVPTFMLIQFYTNPDYGMWHPIDEKHLSSNRPEMMVFPDMTHFYTKWKHSLQNRNVNVRLNTRVTSVVRRSKQGVTVKILRRQRPKSNSYATEGEEKEGQDAEEEYDEIVFCVTAEAALKILGKQASFWERKILGAVKFSTDKVVTHCDTTYMKKHYETEFTSELAVLKLSEKSDVGNEEKAEKSFNPMYLIKHEEENPKAVEMSFNCSQFQPQLKLQKKPFRDQVFQTVFLNDKNRKAWTSNEIEQRKIIRVDEFRQVRHGYQHFLRVPLFLSLLQSHDRHTHFAGAWALVNAHEAAVVSGLAAAYALGAGYPEELAQDEFAKKCFQGYLSICYRKWGKSAKKKGILEKVPLVRVLKGSVNSSSSTLR